MRSHKFARISLISALVFAFFKKGGQTGIDENNTKQNKTGQKPKRALS